MKKSTGLSTYYGHVEIEDREGVFAIGIPNYDRVYWHEIPKYLYDALVRFADERPKT